MIITKSRIYEREIFVFESEAINGCIIFDNLFYPSLKDYEKLIKFVYSNTGGKHEGVVGAISGGHNKLLDFYSSVDKIRALQVAIEANRVDLINFFISKGIRYPEYNSYFMDIDNKVDKFIQKMKRNMKENS